MQHIHQHKDHNDQCFDADSGFDSSPPEATEIRIFQE